MKRLTADFAFFLRKKCYTFEQVFSTIFLFFHAKKNMKIHRLMQLLELLKGV
jgi:hypothetical protein